MALDKQKILNELGSVMNQLQGADCGCMGKLFSNSNTGQEGAAMSNFQPNGGYGGYGGYGACRGGCCHSRGGYNFDHGCGFNAQGGGDPSGGHFMGNCNPKRTYADTYNYLENNLMHPVYQEVYNELKTITPENTVMNNPMAAQLGLSSQGGNAHAGNAMQRGTPMAGDMGMQQNQMMASGMSSYMQGDQGKVSMPEGQMQGSGMGNQMNFSHMVQKNANQNMQQQIMNGMGPEILKMMTNDTKSMNSTPQGGQMPGNMLTNAPQTPYQDNSGMNQEHKTHAAMSNNLIEQMFTPKNQFATKAQPMPWADGNYGGQPQGLPKFREMFPSAMSKDLGFDPMSIAFQMNPANQKMAAVDAINNMMSKSSSRKNSPTTDSRAFPANINFAQDNVGPTDQQNFSPSDQQSFYAQPGSTVTPIAQRQQYGGNMNATMTSTHPNQVPQQQNYYENKVPQQPVYTGALATNQEQSAQQQGYQQHQMVYPSVGVPMQQTISPNQTATRYDNAQMQQQPVGGYTSTEPTPEQGLVIQDPVFPVDTSKFKSSPNMRRPNYYRCNTLGQPVELLPARLYQSNFDSRLPQTLYPQPATGKLRKDIASFNVKSTISKTSLIGDKPAGRTPSRNQLQTIYNQYKGSQSYTQQRVRDPVVQSETYSDGRLGVQRRNTNQARRVPVERIGGDTAANNQMMLNELPMKGQPMYNEPAINKPHGDIIPTKDIPETRGKCRNGLQDIVYSPYQTFAWSFSGNGQMPIPSSYRYQNRAWTGSSLRPSTRTRAQRSR